MNEMLFLETSIFVRWKRKNRLAAAVEKLKLELAADPDRGDVIPGGHGLRKIRMAVPGRGKSGGARVIYVAVLGQRALALLTGYRKAERADLTKAELAVIAGEIAALEAEA